MNILSSINDMSAGEGFSIVLLSGLQAFGALALIVAVLVVMDRVYKKKHPDWEKEAEEKETIETTAENEEGEK